MSTFTNLPDGRVIFEDVKKHSFLAMNNILPHPSDDALILISPYASGQQSVNEGFAFDWQAVTIPAGAADRDALILELSENFFGGASVQNPLPISGGSVYCQDLNLTLSSIGSFNGEICTLFDNYFVSNTAASVGSGGVNPKFFTLVLNRPVLGSTIGIGSPNTSIKNAKLTLFGLAGDIIKIVDFSSDSTPRGILIFQFEQKIFISAKIEFFTDDAVVLGGAGITKSSNVTIDAINGIISRDNSSNALLGIDEVFTGETIDTKNYGIIIVTILSNVISAIDGLDIQFAETPTGIWYSSDTFSLEIDKINVLKPFSVQTVLRYMRVVYTNGGTAQGVFLLSTQLKPVYIKPSSHRLADILSGQDDAELVKAGLLGEDQSGVFQNIKSTEVGNLRVADFLVEVGRGNIPGYAFIRKFGQIDAIQSATPADIWEYGVTSGAEKYTFSADGVADIDTVSSSNSGDTQSIIVEGLDINGDEVIQTAILDGQNKVTLGTSLWRFNRAYNDGSVDFLGNIYIYVDGVITTGVPNVVTTVRGFILAGKGQTNQSIYTVPNSKKIYLFGEEISLTKAGGATVVSADCQGESREFGKVPRNKEFFTLLSSGNSSKLYNFPVPLESIGKTDFIPSADVSANGVGISWAYTMLIIDD